MSNSKRVEELEAFMSKVETYSLPEVEETERVEKWDSGDHNWTGDTSSFLNKTVYLSLYAPDGREIDYPGYERQGFSFNDDRLRFDIVFPTVRYLKPGPTIKVDSIKVTDSHKRGRGNVLVEMRIDPLFLHGEETPSITLTLVN